MADTTTLCFWSDLEHRLDGVLSGGAAQTMSIGDYMAISASVNEYTQTGDASDVRQWVVSRVSGHLATIRRQLSSLAGLSLVSEYVSQWTRYAHISQALSGSLGSLAGQGMRQILARIWHSAVFRHIALRLASATVSLAYASAGGDPQPLVRLHSALSELHVTHGSRSIYAAWYLEPYTWAAVRHVAGATSHVRASIRDYVRTASRLILGEEERARSFVRPESVGLVTCVLGQRFVASRVDEIHSEARAMLAESDSGELRGELRTLFALLRRVADDRVGMQGLRVLFREHVTGHILGELQSLGGYGSGADKSSLGFAQTAVAFLLREAARFRSLVSQCFDSDSGFGSALEDGLRDALNSGQLVGPDYPQIQAPVLLAGYFGQLLQRGSEGDPESRAREALQLCSLVQAKDKLLCHYRALLARRFVTESSVGLEFERTVAGMLLPLATTENTVQIRTILSDMSALVEIPGAPDISFRALSSAAWSGMSSESSPTLIVPTVVSDACDKLTHMYRAKGNGAKVLWWQWAYSKATIQMHFPGSPTPYTLIVNTYQLSILSLFTTHSCLGYAAQHLTLQQISTAIRLHLLTVTSELAVLQRAGILVFSKDVVTVNGAFRSRRLRIDVSGTRNLRQQPEPEIVAIDRHVDDHRKCQIMAVVMAILKRRGRVDHSLLLRLVSTHFEHMFKVTRLMFKNAVESLILREFVRHCDDDAQAYEYDPGY
ncbi:ubiquitin ligase (cullin) of SCF [Coemansia sp. BCRC 34301]|nr:ubiquitin ligase (cullin) of SCF [Coemansia sp. BCRC 34301]